MHLEFMNPNHRELPSLEKILLEIGFVLYYDKIARRMHFNVHPDPRLEEPFYARHAAVHGSVQAQRILARSYASGRKVEKNMQMAACLYLSAYSTPCPGGCGCYEAARLSKVGSTVLL